MESTLPLEPAAQLVAARQPSVRRQMVDRVGQVLAQALQQLVARHAALRRQRVDLVGAKRVATEPEKMELYRSTGRTQQILSTLQELRNNPATPANVMTALGKMQADYVERFGKALKFAKEGATSGKYEQDVETYYAESQFGLEIGRAHV